MKRHVLMAQTSIGGLPTPRQTWCLRPGTGGDAERHEYSEEWADPTKRDDWNDRWCLRCIAAIRAANKAPRADELSWP